MRAFLKLCALPPGSSFVLLLIGLALVRRRRRLGRAVFAGALLLLYVQSTPLVATLALRSLCSEPPIRARAMESVDAIVVLGGDHRVPASEFDPTAPDPSVSETVGELTLERLRYGAHLARLYERPILVTGGRLKHGSVAIAQQMAVVLEREFGVEVAWVEGASGNTFENAVESRALLEPLELGRIALVTHAWHMPRAAGAFRAVGFDVVPAPTVFPAPVRFELGELMPSARALFDTSLACHEWLGRLWYSLAH